MEALKPKRRYWFAISALILVTVLLPRSELHAFSFSNQYVAAAAASTGSFFCDTIGFLLTPLGFCEVAPGPVAESSQSAEPDTPSAPEPDPEPDDPGIAPPPAAAAPQPPTTSTSTVIRETPTYVTNEYITNPTTVIREVVKETVRSGGGGSSSRIDTSEFVTRELLTKQAGVIFDSQSDDMEDIAEAFETELLTVTGNATVGGTLGVTGALTSSAYLSATDASATSTLAGALSVGTTTSRDTLTVGGPIYLADTAPTSTASRLYNQGGSLYWAGSAIAGATVGTWDSNGTDVYRLTGSVGVGTSEPDEVLTISGNTGTTTAVPTAGTNIHLVGADSGQLSLTMDGFGAMPAIIGRRAQGTLASPSSLAFAGYNLIGLQYSGYGTSDYSSVATALSVVTDEGWTDSAQGTEIRLFTTPNGSTAAQRRLTINNDGSVGVGDTGPDGLLEVSASGGASDLLMLSSNDGQDGDRFIVKNNGNVGIGTTSPSRKLTVAGDIYAGGSLTVGDLTSTTSISAPFFTATDASATSTLAGGLNVDSGGLVYSHDSGNVGIGTTSPAYPLVVQGSGSRIQQWLNSSGAEVLRINADGSIGHNVTIANQLTANSVVLDGISNSGLFANGSTFEVRANTNAPILSGSFNADTIIQPTRTTDTDGQGDVGINVNGARALTVENTQGNVGIGTTSPSRKLTVAGDIYAGGSLTVGDLTSTTSVSAPFFTATDSRATSTFAGGLNVGSGGLVYDHDSGNVGIGTADPGAKLDVAGIARALDGNDYISLDPTVSDPNISIFRSGGYHTKISGVASGIDIYGGGGGTTQIAKLTTTGYVFPETNWTLGLVTDTGPVTFNSFMNSSSGGDAFKIRSFNGSGAQEDRFSITGSESIANVSVLNSNFVVNADDLYVQQSNGNVGIGTTSPSALLNVHGRAPALEITSDGVGDVRLTLERGTDGAGLDLYWDSNTGDGFLDTQGTNLILNDSGGNVGIGTTTVPQKLTVDGTIQATNLLGGAVNLTTDANGNIIRDPSDARLKTNVQEIEGALEKVLGLRGVSYEWKDTARFGNQEEVGFVAQEVDLILPEVVRKGGEYWSLNTRNMLAVVVEAIQEMWATVTARLDEHEEDISDLKAENEALRAEVEALKSGEEPKPSSKDTSEDPEPEAGTTDPEPSAHADEPTATSTDPETDEPAATTTAATTTDPDGGDTDQPDTSQTSTTTDETSPEDNEAEEGSVNDDSASASPDSTDTGADTETPAPAPEDQDTTDEAPEPDTADEQAETELAA